MTAGRWPLEQGWTLASTAPGALVEPGELATADLAWRPARVPGTVAQSLDLPLDEPPGIDGRDWWYRCPLQVPAEAGDQPLRLHFEGLATLAEVWLDGRPLLVSRNMFKAASCALPALRPSSELVICFRSLAADRAGAADRALRRPRPRWKTGLVAHQELRWQRTSLLGHIPAWTPPLPAIGPWRPVVLEALPPLSHRLRTLRPWAEEGQARLSLDLELRPGPGQVLESARLVAGALAFALDLVEQGEGLRIQAELGVPGLALWWPHSHGAPVLHDCRVELAVSGARVEIPLGHLGFRSLAMDRRDGRVQLLVNDQPVFCRGACWTVQDLRSLDGAPGETTKTLGLAQAGGLNMIRVGGTMTWPSDELLVACDRLGILLWQDLMLANMDYPVEDPAFREELLSELDEQLHRLRAHPCLAVLCGGSEIAQQAAMLGLPEADWSSPFFTETLPAACARVIPGLPWFPATPWEGPLPFCSSEGLSHYYGVGAYRRPLTDLRLARVRFSPECLGFSNVPEDAALEPLLGGAIPPAHHPAWKAGVPRDAGAGGDFEDVRDHYLALLFDLDAVRLRSTDPERYRRLSRVVTGELMFRAYAEWRRPGSGCGGALVWFLKDLRPGAGWGVLDSDGRPKAAWWYLRRAWTARAVLLTDEGLDGVALHVVNEDRAALSAIVELELLRGGRHRSAGASRPVELAPFEALRLSADALLGAFHDPAWTYRFGPPRHELIVARLREAGSGRLLQQDVLFPLGHRLAMQEDPGLQASLSPGPEGELCLHLLSRSFLQALSIEARGWQPEDNYLHLLPGEPRTLWLRPEPGTRRPFRATLSALNMEGSLTLRAPA